MLVERLKEFCTSELIRQRLEELDIALIYFHGSRAQGRERPQSDYDFAVLLDDRKQWEFLQRVERLDMLGEMLAVELEVPRDSVDIQDLDGMPIGMTFDVVGDGLLLWEGEPKLGLYFKRQAYSRYQDFRWTEDFFRRALRRQILGDEKVG